MLTFKKDSWHARAYTFYFWLANRSYCERTRQEIIEDELAKKINLCPYFRTVLLWMPLRFLWWSAPVSGPLATYLVGCHLMGFWEASVLFAKVIGFLFAFVAAWVALGMASIWIGDTWSERNRWRASKAPKPPSLLRAWFQAKKAKVCPIIRIED